VTSPIWRKSSRSTEGTSSQCVEIAQLSGNIGMRGSKQPDAEHLFTDCDRFAALVERVKRSELDL
jgi:hypothetical protein